MWTETWQQTKSLGSQLFAVWKFDTFKWILWLLCLIYGAGEYISDINLLLISPQKFWLVWWTSLYLFCCCCGYFAKQQLDFHTYRLNPHLSKHHTPSPAHFLYVELFFSSQGVRLVELGDLYFDVSLLLWCCSLVWLTQHGLCSAYAPMLMVAFPLATRLLLAKEFKHRGKDLISKSTLFTMIEWSAGYLKTVESKDALVNY